MCILPRVGIALIVFGVAVAAHAAPVELGQTIFISFENDDGTSNIFVPPTGELLASDTRDLQLTYVDKPGYELIDDPTDPRGHETTVHFHSEVRRDPASGRLSFLYSLTPPSEDALQGREGAPIEVSSFAGFTTDFTGDPGAGSGAMYAARSADGTTITQDDLNPGFGRPRPFALATDATEF